MATQGSLMKQTNSSCLGVLGPKKSVSEFGYPLLTHRLSYSMSRQFQFQFLHMSKGFSGAVYITLEQAYHRVITASNMGCYREMPIYEDGTLKK